MNIHLDTIELPVVVRSYTPFEIVAYFQEKALETGWKKSAIHRVIQTSLTNGVHYFIDCIDKYVDWIEIDYEYELGVQLDTSSNFGLSEIHYG